MTTPRSLVSEGYGIIPAPDISETAFTIVKPDGVRVIDPVAGSCSCEAFYFRRHARCCHLSQWEALVAAELALCAARLADDDLECWQWDQYRRDSEVLSAAVERVKGEMQGEERWAA